MGNKANSPSKARLIELPDGSVSSQFKFTVGKAYKVHGLMGSCLVVDTDVPGETTSISRDRFQIVR